MLYLDWIKQQYARTWKQVARESPADKPFIDLANSGIAGGDDTLTDYTNYARLDAPNGTGWRADVEMNWGHRGLREQLARLYQPASCDDVMTVAGASQALFLTILALSRTANGSVAVGSPSYGPLFEIPRYLGANVRFFHRRLENGYGILDDLAAIRDAHLIVFSNPHNPTGAFVPLAEIDQLLASARPEAVIVVDETFLPLSSAAERSVATRREPRLVSVGSLSKTFGLSSLRCGWIIAHGQTRERIREAWLQGFNIGSRLTEGIAGEVLNDVEAYDRKARERLGTNLPIVATALDDLQANGLISWRRPASSFIAFPRLIKAARGATPRQVIADFCSMLLNEERLAVVPGEFFDPNGSIASAHFRLGFGCTEPQLREGLARLKSAIERF